FVPMVGDPTSPLLESCNHLFTVAGDILPGGTRTVLRRLSVKRFHVLGAIESARHKRFPLAENMIAHHPDGLVPHRGRSFIDPIVRKLAHVTLARTQDLDPLSVERWRRQGDASGTSHAHELG